MGGGERVLINSPFFIHSTILAFQLIAIFFSAAFSGDAVSRDYEYNMFQLIYSKPVTKLSYLLGRFVGNAIVLTMIMLTIGLGILIGSFMPWLDKSYFGRTDLLAYLWPYVTIILPNMIFTCGIFFAVGALTKKQVYVYVSAILLFVFYLVLSILSSKVSMKELVAILDPFAMSTTSFITDKMTPAQRNTELVPLAPILLINRALWLGIGFVLFWVSYAVTTFAYPEARNKAGKKEKNKSKFKPITIDLNSVKKSFTPSQSFKQLYYLTGLEFKNITSRFYFWILVVVGLVLAGFTIKSSGAIYETATLPVTYQVLSGAKGGVATLLMVIITLFTGELLWKSRIHRLDLIMDSTPAKSWVFLFSKYFAMLGIEMIIIILAMLLAIGYQLISGFNNIKLDVYAVDFLFQFLGYARLTAIAFTIHTLVNNKYASHFIFIGVVVLSGFVSLIGLEHPLFSYGSGIGRAYSDMSGWNGNLMKNIISTILWSSYVSLGMLFAYLYSVRGRNNNVKERHMLAKLRLTPSTKIIAGILAVLYLTTASIIFYETNIRNEFHLRKTWTKKAAANENKYKKYDGMLGPRVTDVSLKVDLYPNEGRGVLGGTLTLKNKEIVPLDSMYVSYNQNMELVNLEFSKPTTMAFDDDKNGIRVYHFDEPLQPEETFTTEFKFIEKPEGFGGSRVVKNGTFFTNKDFVPSFAYNSQGEISSPDKRKKMGLPPKERMATVDDEKGRLNTYISNDSDWVNYEVVMSTIASQTAISPGYVIDEWEENGRKYTHYQMDKPILNFVAFLSAELEVKKAHWKNKKTGQEVDLAVYYDEEHPYNVDRMLNGMKNSLSYYTNSFGPFQNKVLRIVEFPRWATYAQSFPTTIPFSEGIGFIANVREKKKDIDYPYWVTCHEVAHQWWAHQVIGGNVQGSVMLSEAFAQYSSVKVMEKKFGDEMVGKFLKNELNSYVMGRNYESREEQPLYKVENQQYIHYNKGAIVMYGMASLIGGKSMNRALSSYLEAVKFQDRPYTNTIEFLGYLEKETPDSLLYLIDDWYRKIVVYDNKVTNFKYTKPSDEEKQYTVDFDVEVAKMYDNGKGEYTDTEMNDWIEVAVLGTKFVNGKEKEYALDKQLVKITDGKQHFTIKTKKKPVKVGVDPYFKLIDKNPFDNIINVSGAVPDEMVAVQSTTM
jgi:ABC-type transport system involved in multi-copper enzyme maturation permease subunit